MRTIVVVAGVIFERDRVLVTQRRAGAHLAGAWEFPGGKLEEGEDPTVALARELREELGVEVTVKGIVEVAFHRYEDAGKAVLLLFYEACILQTSPPPRAIEVADFAWWTSAELDPALFPAADVGVLEKVRARLGQSLIAST